MSIARCATSFTVPSYGGSVQNTYCTAGGAVVNQNGALPLIALEYLLGTLTVSGNTFSSAGSTTMPSKTIEGVSIQTASLLPVVVATAALTATTPVLTITYTDQDGNSGNSCVMTLPTSPSANSGYLMIPKLASDDTGVQAVTNMSISTGSAGTLKVYGLLPLIFGITCQAANGSKLDPLALPFPVFPIAAAETIGFYNFNATAAVDLQAFVSLEPDA